MATLESWQPSDLKAAERYAGLALQLRGLIAETGNEPLTMLSDQLTAATIGFGRAELHFRIEERRRLLDRKERRKPVITSARGQRHHERGLKALDGVDAGLERLRAVANEIDARPGPKPARELERELRTWWDEAVDDLDAKPSDAVRLRKEVDECLGAMSRGASGLAGHISDQFRELRRVRELGDRGTSDNWPVWKIVSAAIWLGISFALVYDLITRGRPWWEFAMTILIALIGTLLIALGC